MKSLSLPASRSSLGAVLDFANRSCEELGIAGPAAFAVRLAIEEVCINVMSYSYAGREEGPLTVAIERDAGYAIVTVIDRGAPFSPADAPAPDLTTPAEERRVGGLGVFLVGELMDSVSYTSDAAEGNRLEMRKRL